MIPHTRTLSHAESEHTEYSQSDIKSGVILLARMMPYMAQGMTRQEAGAAVLARDRQLYELVSVASGPRSEIGDAIAHDLATQVYQQLRKQQAGTP